MGAHVDCLPARVFPPPASWNALHPGGATSLSLFTSQLKCHPLREFFPNYDTSSVIVYTDNEHFPKLSSVMPTLLMAYFPIRITRTGTLPSLFPIVSHVPKTVPGIHQMSRNIFWTTISLVLINNLVKQTGEHYFLILQIKKLRPRNIKWLAQHHTARK